MHLEKSALIKVKILPCHGLLAACSLNSFLKKAGMMTRNLTTTMPPAHRMEEQLGISLKWFGEIHRRLDVLRVKFKETAGTTHIQYADILHPEIG